MHTLKVACAIILNEDHVLIAQRSEIMTLPFKWEFPGGKIKVGEGKETCLHRELHEELNIKVEIIKSLKSVFYDYGTFTIELYPFIVNIISGPIKINEHNQIAWVSIAELKSVDFAAADLLILEKYINIK